MEDAGKDKIKEVLEKAGQTLPNTAPRGQEVIQSETKSLNEEFETCFSTITEKKSQLGE